MKGAVKFLGLLMGAFLLTGCITLPPLDPAVDPTMYVYPVIDARENKDIALENFKNNDGKSVGPYWPLTGGFVPGGLQSMRIITRFVPPDPQSRITAGTLENRDLNILQSELGDKEYDVFFLVIKEYKTEIRGIRKVDVELAGYLYDPRANDIVWENSFQKSYLGSYVELFAYSPTGRHYQRMTNSVLPIINELPVKKLKEKIKAPLAP